jgi:hypothetical protein
MSETIWAKIPYFMMSSCVTVGYLVRCLWNLVLLFAEVYGVHGAQNRHFVRFARHTTRQVVPLRQRIATHTLCCQR